MREPYRPPTTINRMPTDFLTASGDPNLPELINAFQRCAPAAPGGLEWMDAIANCRWANQSNDGRKHDVRGDPRGGAQPWDGASDCRPMVVDDAVNDLVSLLTSAFWRSMAQPGGSATESGGYAVALAEHLVFTQMLNELTDEVELAAQYTCRYGWCLLAPRWIDEIGLKRQKVTLQELTEFVAQTGGPELAPQVNILILDPALEDAAVEFIRGWYDMYAAVALPERLRERAPKTSAKVARQAVRALRETGSAETLRPYLCRSEPEISALKPWEDVFVPPEMSARKLELVFYVEYLSEAELRGRILADEYSEPWVEAALKFKGAHLTNTLPVGTSGQALSGLNRGASGPSPQAGTITDQKHGLVAIVHAVYRAADADNVPAVYCTTFHPGVAGDKNGQPLFGKHEVVQSSEGSLPYVDLRFEAVARPLASSRGVPEMTHTDQNLIKGLNDQMIDRASLTTIPPINIYTSPTGAQYRFAPAAQNHISPGREPKFMDVPSASGAVDNLKAEERVSRRVDNRFGLPAADVPPTRAATKQERIVRRFLLAWARAVQQALCLYQTNGSDAEFARITGAPPGWLDKHRDQPGFLSCALEFDPRDLDLESFVERVKAMNTLVLPNDVLGVINRAGYAGWMARGFLGPAVARQIVQPQNEASQALYERAHSEVLKMVAGNQPAYLDKMDPTAGALLQNTQQIVSQNPKYMQRLTDEALVTLGGPQGARQMVEMMDSLEFKAKFGGRMPDENFSKLLVNWLENLKFQSITQPANKQTGRIGVNPQG